MVAHNVGGGFLAGSYSPIKSPQRSMSLAIGNDGFFIQRKDLQERKTI
jgi:hypothetical protein